MHKLVFSSRRFLLSSAVTLAAATASCYCRAWPAPGLPLVRGHAAGRARACAGVAPLLPLPLWNALKDVCCRELECRCKALRELEER